MLSKFFISSLKTVYLTAIVNSLSIDLFALYNYYVERKSQKMDIKKLNYFIAAADTGNFSKAADSYGIAQTTMSKYIAGLEEEFDCALFVRTNKGCELTEHGRLLYEKA